MISYNSNGFADGQINAIMCLYLCDDGLLEYYPNSAVNKIAEPSEPCQYNKNSEGALRQKIYSLNPPFHLYDFVINKILPH